MAVIISFIAEFWGNSFQGILEGPNFPLFNTKCAAKNTQQTLVSIILAKFDNPLPLLTLIGASSGAGGWLPPPIYLGSKANFSPKIVFP